MNARVLMIFGLAALWSIGIYGLLMLPAMVPSSWGADGIVRYGSKYSLLILPIVGLVGYWIIVRSQKRQDFSMGLPFEIPPQRLDAAKTVGRQYLGVVGAVLMIGFASIEAVVVSSAKSGQLIAAFPFVVLAIVVAIVATVLAMFINVWRVARA